MVLFAPIQELLRRSWGKFIDFVIALLVFVIGWLVAKLIRAVVVKVLKACRVDSIAEQMKVGEFLAKGGVKYNVSELTGMVIYWIIIVGVLISSLNVLNLQGVTGLLDRILGYLPHVMGAVIILVLGALISTLVASVVRTATANVGFAQSGILGKVAQVAIVVFTILIALEALNIGKILTSAMNIVLGAIGLGVALAFGLGCKDIAADFVADIIAKLKKK